MKIIWIEDYKPINNKEKKYVDVIMGYDKKYNYYPQYIIYDDITREELIKLHVVASAEGAVISRLKEDEWNIELIRDLYYLENRFSKTLSCIVGRTDIDILRSIEIEMKMYY